MVLVWNPRGKAQSSLSASSICINYLEIKWSFHWVGWWLKTKCQPKWFFDVSIRKEKGLGCLLLFSIWNHNKNFGWHLVFSIWFLVTGLSNEKNKTYQFFVATWTIPPFWMSIPPLWTSFRTTGILWERCQTIFRTGPIGLISAHWAPLNWSWSTIRIISKITFPPLVIYSNPNCRIWKTRYFSNWNNEMKCKIKCKYLRWYGLEWPHLNSWA